MFNGQAIISNSNLSETQFPILICLLGNFCLLKNGHSVSVRNGGKAEALLCSLAMRPGYCLPREVLLNTLWPNSETTLASQSLHSLIHSLHKQLGDCIGGAAPVFYLDGTYHLNIEAGVSVDVKTFDAFAELGHRTANAGNRAGAIPFYIAAIALYHGDLHVGNDVHTLIERERLRALYLTALAYVADYYFAEGNYSACLDYALRLLTTDPYREDAHRVAMRCYVRRGERAQALRQYRLCEDLLHSEFDALPEPHTKVLFDLIRHNSGSI